MSDGALFDTNSLLWFRNGAIIRAEAYEVLSLAQESHTLFASSISIWELGLAVKKKNSSRRPDLQGLTPRAWFSDAIHRLRVQVIAIDTDIAAEAADVAPDYGSGDPGDCLLLATAHVRNLSLITRDSRILDFARMNPTYLSVVRC